MFVQSAFSALSTDRPIGAMGGCGQIPWSSIMRYAEFHEITDPEEFERFRRLIIAMDGVYLEHVRETMKAESEKRKTEKDLRDGAKP